MNDGKMCIKKTKPKVIDKLKRQLKRKLQYVMIKNDIIYDHVDLWFIGNRHLAF